MTRATAAAEPAGQSYGKLVQDIRRDGRLTAAELANLTGVQERQVQNWAAGKSLPGGDSRARLVDVFYVVNALSAIYKPEGVDIWLHGRNRALRGRRPIDLLAEGDFEPVIREVDAMNVGAM